MTHSRLWTTQFKLFLFCFRRTASCPDGASRTPTGLRSTRRATSWWRQTGSGSSCSRSSSTRSSAPTKSSAIKNQSFCRLGIQWGPSLEQSIIRCEIFHYFRKIKTNDHLFHSCWSRILLNVYVIHLPRIRIKIGFERIGLNPQHFLLFD